MLTLVAVFILRDEKEVLPVDYTEDIVDQLIEDRVSKIEDVHEVEFDEDHIINVLVLGLDARKESVYPHCDAIHMFSLNVRDWTIKITSVPRGTYSYIPGEARASSEYYVSNACAFVGLDYGVERIEKIIGIKADYTVTAGFSQVIGILRMFDLPTTESLQWLRHRQSYAIGDPQRSHNQAVFMKDMILNHTEKFRNKFSLPAKYVLFSFVNTDMDFEMANSIINGFVESKIDDRPEDIILEMRPWFDTKDYHLDFENPNEQIEGLIEFMRPYLSEDDLSERPLELIQEDLVDYLYYRSELDEPVDDILEKQLWLQVESAPDREELQFEFLIREIKDYDNELAKEKISDYILEKEIFGEDEWVENGRRLLEEYL